MVVTVFRVCYEPLPLRTLDSGFLFPPHSEVRLVFGFPVIRRHFEAHQLLVGQIFLLLICVCVCVKPLGLRQGGRKDVVETTHLFICCCVHSSILIHVHPFMIHLNLKLKSILGHLNLCLKEQESSGRRACSRHIALLSCCFGLLCF